MKRSFWVIFALISFVSVQANQATHGTRAALAQFMGGLTCEAQSLDELGQTQAPVAEGSTFESVPAMPDCSLTDGVFTCWWQLHMYLQVSVTDILATERSQSQFTYLMPGRIKPSLLRADQPIICKFRQQRQTLTTAN